MSSGARLEVIEDDAAILYPDDEQARSSHHQSHHLGPGSARTDGVSRVSSRTPTASTQKVGSVLGGVVDGERRSSLRGREAGGPSSRETDPLGLPRLRRQELVSSSR
jgi:hypothetical protein